MICPQCHEAYTYDEPCPCQAPARARVIQPGPLHVSPGNTDESLSPELMPTGIDNPFWKA